MKKKTPKDVRNFFFYFADNLIIKKKKLFACGVQGKLAHTKI